MALDQSKWKFVVTDTNGNVPQGAGEVYVPSQRTYSDILNGGRVCGCTIPVDHPRAEFLLNNDALMKLYRLDRTNNWKLLLNGDVISTEEQGDGTIESIQIVAADPFVRVNRRLIGMAVDSNGRGTGFTVGTPTVPIDLSLAASQVLQQVNTDFFCGLSAGTTQLCGTTGVVGPLYSAFAGPTIQQICATLGGPDFWIDPQEPSGNMPGTILGKFNVGFARGTFRPNAIFEYGMGRHNVSKYDRLLTKQGACNNAVALPPGWPSGVATGDAVASYSDSVSQMAISRYDDVVSTDVSNLDLRKILCQESVQVRKQKQQQITFQPSVDNPLDYTVDYTTGDVVVARVYKASTNSYRYNGSIRMYGVALTLDDSDSETTTLTLIPDSVSGGVS